MLESFREFKTLSIRTRSLFSHFFLQQVITCQTNRECGYSDDVRNSNIYTLSLCDQDETGQQHTAEREKTPKTEEAVALGLKSKCCSGNRP